MDILPALVRQRPLVLDIQVDAKSFLVNNNTGAELNLKSNLREIGNVPAYCALTSPCMASEQITVNYAGVLTGSIDISFSTVDNALTLVPISNISVDITNAVIPVSGNVNATVTGAVTITAGTVNIGTVTGLVNVDTSPTPLSDTTLKSGPNYAITSALQTVLAATNVSSYSGIRFVAGHFAVAWQLQLFWWDAAPGPTGYNIITDYYDIICPTPGPILDYCFPTKAPYLLVKVATGTWPLNFDYFDIFGERNELKQTTKVLAEGSNVNILAGATMSQYLGPWFGPCWLHVYLASANVGMWVLLRSYDYTLSQQSIVYRRSTVGLANDALQEIRDCPIFLGTHIHRLDVVNQDAVARGCYYAITTTQE